LTAAAPTEVRRRLPAAARRARIATAAQESFAARGYEATSLGDIASAAGVSRPVLYDHFPSKKALFLWLLEQQQAELIEHVAGLVRGKGPPSERMREAIDALLAFVQAHPFAWRMLFRETGGEPEVAAAHARLQAEGRAAARDVLADDLVRAGIDPGSERAELLVEMLTSSIQGLAGWWYDHPDTPRERLLEAAMDVLWGGLARLVDGQ
jgi:AcrR family transcriptional regulator